MSKLLATAILISIFTTGNAAAQNCVNLPEGRISPVTFDQAIASLSNTGAAIIKDEFETTAQFEARQAAAAAVPSALVVSLTIDAEYVTYNADAGVFAIQPYAITNGGTDWSDLFYGSPHYDLYRNSYSGDLALVVSRTDEANGTYTGQNAYGASWEITRINRTLSAIFEGKVPHHGANLWGNSSATNIPTWNIPVPVEQAREFKSKLRAALLIAPKAPFFFERTKPSSLPVTIQHPRNITETSRVIFADIQCLIFVDDTDNVLLSIATN